jgi:hypothetical protein
MLTHEDIDLLIQLVNSCGINWDDLARFKLEVRNIEKYVDTDSIIKKDPKHDEYIQRLTRDRSEVARIERMNTIWIEIRDKLELLK